MSDIVFAVVGMSGSGKSEVVAALLELTGARQVYFGGVVIEEIKRQGRVVTEDAEAEIRMALRREHGMAAMAILRLQQINEAVSLGLSVVIDGGYSYAEFLYLKKKIGRNFVTVAVHAPFFQRVERLATRKVRPLGVEEIKRRDMREIETMEKGGPIAVADFQIVNDGSITLLRERIDRQVLGNLRRHREVCEANCSRSA